MAGDPPTQANTFGNLTTSPRARFLLVRSWWGKDPLRSAVSERPDPSEQRQLHPLPRGLVELYGLIAVLVVLIPEWLADGTLNLGHAKSSDSLPMRSRAWRTLPELRLAAMTLAELRQAAAELRMYQYGSATRDQLTIRLLRRLRRRNAL